MTLGTFDNPDVYHVVMTECPYCSEPLTPGINFVEHWPDCPVNTDTTSGEHGEADR